MRVGSRCQNRPSLATISRRRLQERGPLTTTRRLLRGKDQRRQVTSPSHWTRKDQVHGRDVLVPVGEQDRRIPCGTSRYHRQPHRSRHSLLLWNGPSGRVTPLRIVSSRPSVQTSGETHLSTLQELCRRRNA